MKIINRFEEADLLTLEWLHGLMQCSHLQHNQFREQYVKLI